MLKAAAIEIYLIALIGMGLELNNVETRFEKYFCSFSFDNLYLVRIYTNCSYVRTIRYFLLKLTSLLSKQLENTIGSF